MDAEWTNDRDSVLRLASDLRCPTLVIQGSQDAVVGPARGAAVADAIPHAQLITLDGCGHAPHLRDPVRTNLLIRDFVSSSGTAASVGLVLVLILAALRPNLLVLAGLIGLAGMLVSPRL
jgi:hypothetical protein